MFKLLITLIPTIWFVLILLWGFLIGLKRGFRKSTILLIHAAIALTIAVIFYLVMVNLEAADEMIVTVTNNFMGAGGLQRSMGVSEANKTLSDVLTEYIIKSVNYGEGMTLALEENAHYLTTLVSFAYHVVFFFVALLVYDILLFLFYIIYLIFYSEGKHKRKMEAKEKEDGSTVMYRKRHLLGSLIGTLRALVKAIVVMSFIGATLFLIGGGLGNYEYKKEYSFSDPNRKRYFEVYEALGSYGNTGIFKVLNVIKDDNEVPYYFFIANTVLSGKYENPDLGINRNVYFAREIGEYTRFMRETFDLMMATDEDTMLQVINGEIEVNDEKVLAILGNEEFQGSFTKLIDKIESNTYVIDFSLSLIDSIASHYDKTDLSKNVNDKTNELIKVMLVDSYYSPYVPDDATKKANGEKVATIKISNLLERNDVKLIATALLSLLAQPKDLTQSEMVFNYNRYLVPALKSLSILNDEERKKEINPALERIFVAIENMYDRKDDNQLTVEKVELLSEGTSIDWAGELGNLLDSLYNLGNLAENVYDPNDSNIMNAMFKIFDKTNAKYNDNISNYDKLTANLESSKILDKILNIDPIYDGMMSAFTSLYGDIYIPNISFANQDDSYGEIHYFLAGLKAVMTSGDNVQIISELLGNGGSSSSMIETIAKFAKNIIADGTDEGSILDIATKSKMMQVVLSCLIFSSKNLGNFEIYIPNSARVLVDTEYKNLINQNELREMLLVLPSFAEEIKKYANSTDKKLSDVINIIDSASTHIYESDIIEGTISKIIINAFKDNDSIIIPSNLDTPEEWLAANDGSGELRAIAKIINKIGIDIDTVNAEGFADKVGTLNTTVEGTSETKLDLICNSGVLYATFSNTLDKYVPDSGSNQLVDANAKKEAKILIDGYNYYKKEELKTLIDIINEMNLNVKTMSMDNVTNNVANLNSSSIVDSSISKLDLLYNSTLSKSMLYLKLKDIITSNAMLVDHDNAKEITTGNYVIYKKDEVKVLINFLNNIGSTTMDSINTDSITLNDNAINNITDSEILKASVSKELIDENVLVIINTDYDFTNNYIKSASLNTLLKSIRDGLGISAVGSFDESQIKIPSTDEKTNKLLESTIMQSTISSKINAGSGLDIYANQEDATKTKDYLNNDIIVVSVNELKAFIKGAGDLSTDGGYEVSISDSKLHTLKAEGKLAEVLNSCILHTIISNFLIDEGIPVDSTNKEVMATYNITAVEEVNLDVVKKAYILAYV